MPEEISDLERRARDKLAQGTILAIDTLMSIMKVGNERKDKQHRAPEPINAKEKASYMANQLKAAQTLLELRFGSKIRTPLKPIKKDAEEEALRHMSKMSPIELKSYTNDKVERGEITEGEAEELRRMVRTYGEA